MRDRFLKFLVFGATGLCCSLSGCGSSEPPDSPASETVAPEQDLPEEDTLELERFPTVPHVSGEKQDSSADTMNSEQAVAEPVPAEPLATPKLSDAELQEIGIEVFESSRLRLLVDQVQPASEQEISELPSLAESFFAWVQEEYPAFLEGTDQAEWRWTGHVMREPALFRQAGLLPEEIADLSHGKNRGWEFWMVEQPTSYYRRHLLLHEATHSVMNARFNQWPIWYLEGMAELLACHRLNADGPPDFAVTPGQAQVEGGFGRLALLRSEIAEGRFRSIADVRRLNVDNFYPHKTSYAWSWAVCHFLSEHPQTATRFHQLSRIRTNPEFDRQLDSLLSSGGVALERDWAAFVSSLTPGFDLPRMLVTADETSDTSAEWELLIDRSWQASPFTVESGETWAMTARGQFTLSKQPQPWISEAWGVSLAFVDGRPRGELQMAILPEDSSGERELANPRPVGAQHVFQADRAGRLYFRINERADDWADNSGGLVIQLTPGENRENSAGD